jgi:hypothetical protein
MQSASILDVARSKLPAVLKLPSGIDESLLVGRHARFVLNIRFDVVNVVRTLSDPSYLLAGAD